MVSSMLPSHREKTKAILACLPSPPTAFQFCSDPSITSVDSESLSAFLDAANIFLVCDVPAETTQTPGCSVFYGLFAGREQMAEGA